MEQHDTDAIIAGGGIGGLAAAVALRQAGLRVLVCERSEAIDPVGAGLTLWANALKALHALGLADAIQELGVPELGGGIRSRQGRMLTEMSADRLQRRFGIPSIGIHRADLQRVLLDALPPDTVRLGAACTGFAHDEQGVEVRLANGARLHGRLLIGADGLRSTVRAELFGDAPPRYAGYTAWRGVTEFPHARLRPGETWGRGARFGQVALSGGHVYWFATANAPEGAGDAPGGRKRELLDRFAGWHDPILDLIAATPEETILRNDIYDRPPLARWSDGRVTLLGDAAHPMTPNLGQGACQALEDAVVLGRCLRADGDVNRAVRRYEALRRPRTRAITMQSRRIGRVAQWRHPLACRLRDELLAIAPAQLQERGLAPILAYDATRIAL